MIRLYVKCLKCLITNWLIRYLTVVFQLKSNHQNHQCHHQSSTLIVHTLWKSQVQVSSHKLEDKISCSGISTEIMSSIFLHAKYFCPAVAWLTVCVDKLSLVKLVGAEDDKCWLVCVNWYQPGPLPNTFYITIVILNLCMSSHTSTLHFTKKRGYWRSLRFEYVILNSILETIEPTTI